VLPALAADALVGNHPLPNIADRLRRRLEEMEIVYWRQAAVAIRVTWSTRLVAGQASTVARLTHDGADGGDVAAD